MSQETGRCEEAKALRGELQFLAGGLIALGVAAILALPAISDSRWATGAMICFAISVPVLSTFVLMYRLHDLIPEADAYDPGLGDPPYKAPPTAVVAAVGFISGLLGIALILFDFWWICGVIFVVLMIAGAGFFYAYWEYLGGLVMAAEQQGKERARIEKILLETGQYDPAADPERYQFVRPADPGLRQLMVHAHAYAHFHHMYCGESLVSGEVFQGGKRVGSVQVTQAIPGAILRGRAFAELVLFEDEQVYERFKSSELAIPDDVAPVMMQPGAADGAQYKHGLLVFVQCRHGGREATDEPITVAGQTFIFEPDLPWWKNMFGRRARREEQVNRWSEALAEWRRVTFAATSTRDPGNSDAPKENAD